jgi:CRISPR-associated protein Cas2
VDQWDAVRQGSIMLYLVAYDVADDRRRERIAKILAGYGMRIQYSAFVLDLTDSDLSALRTRLERIVDREEDRVHLLHTCRDCRRASYVLGRGLSLDDSCFKRGKTWVV